MTVRQGGTKHASRGTPVCRGVSFSVPMCGMRQSFPTDRPLEGRPVVGSDRWCLELFESLKGRVGSHIMDDGLLGDLHVAGCGSSEPEDGVIWTGNGPLDYKSPQLSAEDGVIRCVAAENHSQMPVEDRSARLTICFYATPKQADISRFAPNVYPASIFSGPKATNSGYLP